MQLCSRHCGEKKVRETWCRLVLLKGPSRARLLGSDTHLLSQLPCSSSTDLFIACNNLLPNLRVFIFCLYSLNGSFAPPCHPSPLLYLLTTHLSGPGTNVTQKSLIPLTPKARKGTSSGYAGLSHPSFLLAALNGNHN